ncbi:MAG: hypothetical protein IPJ81_16740 [Chitinophagaceae bacterium]|nr:hypothetical protein [Chitinophagaceae bacterium]
MFNVDNPVSLVGYLSREQYGDWPILYGQDFTADIKRDGQGRPEMVEDGTMYIKGKDNYIDAGVKQSYQYNSEDMHFLPRMWDASNDQVHADYYASWMGMRKDEQGNYVRPDPADDPRPTMAENIGFFATYQVNWMYWRYFMWNFAGKQNDIQGVHMGNVRDGNWITGISFFDNLRLGNQGMLPDSLKDNKANNKLYALPFILGILGLVYHASKNKRDALVVGLLFSLCFAIVLYLNQAGNQPRERDYAYVGSFYAFAIWIGLGVLYVKDLINRFIKSSMGANIIAAVLCMLAVPILMASQEWDDHDRSKKVLARDLAIDYLESCAPNAIVISYGDNDTYPLWYAQEVEGIRKDIRVINSSLLGTDWYINQLRYKVNNSNLIDPILTAEQIAGPKRDVTYFSQKPVAGQPEYADLYTVIKDYIGSDDPSRMLQGNDGSFINTFPTKKVRIPVDINLVKQNGTVNASDSVLMKLILKYPVIFLVKNELAILSIIASSKWQRPIYFTSPRTGVGLDAYLRQDGLTYRLVPVKGSDVNHERVADVMMNKFVFGNANVPGVYFDEENRRHLNSIRQAYATAAISLAVSGKKEQAQKLLNRCDTMMLEQNFPYGMVSRSQQHNYTSMIMLQAAYISDNTKLAEKVAKSVKKDLEQQLAYYAALDDNKRDNLAGEEAEALKFLKNFKYGAAV